jgi:putative phosphoesterase
MTKTVAIISDTHAHLDERIADIIRECDYAIHAGDICGEFILEAMHPKTGKIYAVAGNNDSYLHGDSVPQQNELELPGGKICIEHGHLHGMQKPSHDSLRKAYPDAKVIVYGHTHSMLQDKKETPWIINPGAAGRTRTRGGPSCLVLKANDEEWHIQEIRFAETEDV